MIAARLAMITGALVCAGALVQSPPITGLALPGSCLVIFGWLRGERLRQLEEIEKGRRDRLRGLA